MNCVLRTSGEMVVLGAGDSFRFYSARNLLGGKGRYCPRSSWEWNCAEPVQQHPQPVPAEVSWARVKVNGSEQREWRISLFFALWGLWMEWEYKRSSQVLWHVFHRELKEPYLWAGETLPGTSLLQVLFSRNTVVLKTDMIIYVGVAGAD